MLRWTARSLPPTGLSTLGFDPARYQTEPPSLLPGSLATTRTGLTPAGGDELIFGSGHPSTTSESLGTRRSSRKRRQRSGLGCCRDLRYRGAPLTLHRMGVPVTRYARVGGVNIAYQGDRRGAVGSGLAAEHDASRRTGVGEPCARAAPEPVRVVLTTDRVRQARYRDVRSSRRSRHAGDADGHGQGLTSRQRGVSRVAFPPDDDSRRAWT